MRKTLLVALLCLSFSALAQTNWLRKFGGITHEEILDATKDASGNIILVGYFTGALNPGTGAISSAGNSDILIIKMTSDGDFIWAQKAGGIGADRAYSVDVDAIGNIYVTGYFFATASFGATTLTALDRDVFVSKLDPLGNFVWTMRCGGPFGDTGYGVASDPFGNVYITGQYRGTADFGATTLSSMLNPVGDPSYDFFLTKLDNTGNFLWTQDGKAKYDDRGLSVCTDDAGFVFVTGQFSDTITYDVTHNNDAQNCGFLMMFDGSGTEMWFDQFKAYQCVVYDSKWDGGNIYVTGDFRGHMEIQHPGGTEDELSPHPFNIFVAKFQLSGEPAFVSHNHSGNEVTSKHLALDDVNDIYVTGTFKCDFTEMNEIYGNSTFLSVGYRDVYASKFLNNGTFSWSRQIGSPKDDYCSSIVMNSIDHPVLAGSYETQFNIPAGSTFDNPSGDFSSTGGLNCSDGAYGHFVKKGSAGMKDIFVTDFYDPDRLPYDFYIQSGPCTYDTPSPCIAACADTVDYCGAFLINISNFQYGYPYSPIYEYLWITDETTDAILVGTTGDYSVEIARADGCWNWNDSIYAIVHPFPEPPLITDYWGYNYFQPPITTPIDTCSEDSLFLYGHPADTLTDSIFWYNGVFVDDTTVMVDTADYYVLISVTEFGCENYNEIEIILDDFALHDTFNPHIIFLDPDLNATDSIQICELEEIHAYLLDSNFIHPSGGFPFKWCFWWLDGTYMDSIRFFPNFIPPDPEIDFIFSVTAEGWHSIDVHLVNECADSVDYFIHRDFYVDIVPWPEVNVYGPPMPQCPGDTITLYALHFSDTVTWDGESILFSYGDSIELIVGTEPQLYYATVDTVTPFTTCSNSDFLEVTPYPEPLITMDPSHGTVCPGDSVLLTCDSGIAWQWVSPTGDDLGTAITQWVNLPGLYHCIVTLASGCILTSNFVEVKEYSSPYLIVDEYILCTGDSTLVQVIGPPEMVITWLPPLTGGGPVMYIDSTGTYYCQTEFCGITQIDSFTIYESTLVIDIAVSGDTILCLGGEATLVGTPGMDVYIWNGDATIGSVLVTEIPGPYVLTVTDPDGCTATSDTVWIGVLPEIPAPVVSDTSVCIGEVVTLQALSSGVASWFTTDPFFIIESDSLELGSVFSDTTYLLFSTDSSCTSDTVSVSISVYESTDIPAVYGDSIWCETDIVSLWTDSLPVPAEAWWILPDGSSVSGFTIPISVDSLSEGTYSLHLDYGGCMSDTAEISVDVSSYPFADIMVSDTILCPGEFAELLANTDGMEIEWSTGDTSLSIYVSTTGTYYYEVSIDGCGTVSAAVDIEIWPDMAPPPVIDTLICIPESLSLSAPGYDSVIWFGDSWDTLASGTYWNIGPVYSYSEYYYAVSDSGFCPSYGNIYVYVIDPVDPSYLGTASVCPGTWISLSALDPDSSGTVWLFEGDTVATGPSFGGVWDTPGTYHYVLIYDSLCGVDSVDVSITIFELPISELGEDTVFCMWEEPVLISDYQYSYYWAVDSATFDTLAIFTFVDSNGCYIIDTLIVHFINCDLFAPNVFTPDGDGINDLIYFEAPHGEILEFIVINRWGEEIYKSAFAEWNGLTKDGDTAPDGTYFWVLLYEDHEELGQRAYGHLYLTR